MIEQKTNSHLLKRTFILKNDRMHSNIKLVNSCNSCCFVVSHINESHDHFLAYHFIILVMVTKPIQYWIDMKDSTVHVYLQHGVLNQFDHNYPVAIRLLFYYVTIKSTLDCVHRIRL